MTKFAEAKNYIYYLAKYVQIPIAQEIISEYEYIKNMDEFTAARYIIQIFEGINKELYPTEKVLVNG